MKQDQDEKSTKSAKPKKYIIGIVDWGDLANPWEARYVKNSGTLNNDILSSVK